MKRLSIFCAIALGLSDPALSQEPAADAQSEEVFAAELAGSFLMVPQGEGPFPAIIVLGGSEGGDSTARTKARLFVDQGYAVIGYPYYSPRYYGREAQFPALPAAFHNIPVDRLEEVLNRARSDARIGTMPIGLYGVSKGAEFALLAASKIDGFSAVAAIVPSDVVWEGWGPGTVEGESSSFSWRGEPLPFVPYIGMNEEIAKYSDSEATVRLRTPQDEGRHANPDRVNAARIRIEEIDEPVLVAGGDQDTTWASGEMAQYLAERRYEAGLDTISLIFPDAGHALSGTGTQPETSTYRYSPADLAAQQVVWPATSQLFKQHLKQNKQANR